MVLFHLQEVIHICMPWLKVHRKRAFPLTTTLVNIACGFVEVAKHGNKSIAVAIGTSNVRSSCAYVGNSNSNATSAFRNQRTLLQGVIDALNAIIFHREQE